MLHTDIPTLSTLRVLAAHRHPSSVSIYLTTSPIPSESEASRIGLRNQVAAAVSQLSAAQAPESQIEAFEDAMSDLLQDRPFWSYLSHSLVLFFADGHVQTFRVPNNLPVALEVSDRFYIKPLVRSVTFPQTAFVLALSQNSVRLIEVTAGSEAFEMTVPDLPTDAASAVGLPSISGRSPSGRIQGSEGQKVRLTQYSRSVDAAIRPVVAGSDLPLIVAATEPLRSIFRSIASYSHLAKESIEGNPDEKTAEELAAQSRVVLDALYAQELSELAENLAERLAEGRGATDLSDIARAATFGAVDLLVVDMDQSIPGSIDELSGAVTFDTADDAHNYGVVDEIVRRALLSGARVLAVRASDVPGGGPAAAVTRFPV